MIWLVVILVGYFICRWAYKRLVAWATIESVKQYLGKNIKVFKTISSRKSRKTTTTNGNKYMAD